MTLSGYSFPKFVTFRIENSDDLCGQDIEFSLLLKNIHDCWFGSSSKGSNLK